MLTFNTRYIFSRHHVALVVTYSVSNEDRDGCDQAHAHQHQMCQMNAKPKTVSNIPMYRPVAVLLGMWIAE